MLRGKVPENKTVTNNVQQTLNGSYIDFVIVDKLSFWRYSARFLRQALGREGGAEDYNIVLCLHTFPYLGGRVSDNKST